MLVITLQRAGAETCAVRLLPALAPGTFPLAKLAPERNNLRASLGPAAAGKAGAGKDAPALPPTPHYNAAVIQAWYHPSWSACSLLATHLACIACVWQREAHRMLGWSHRSHEQ